MMLQLGQNKKGVCLYNIDVMEKYYYSTSEIAKATGVHPNTVRLYEKWGWLPPVKRSPAGYRRFTPLHLDCMRLARLVMGGAYPGQTLRRSGNQIVRQAASGDLGGALELAYHHLALVQSEQAHAEAAVKLLKRWASGTPADKTGAVLQVGQAAKLLGVTIDMLRNWERNGLIRVPRNPHNGYRQYQQEHISRLRVIRMLVKAGYSMMAVLRMMTHMDQGKAGDLREVLDTPREDEDVYTAADRWLSSLAEQEERGSKIILLLEEMIAKQGEGVY